MCLKNEKSGPPEIAKFDFMWDLRVSKWKFGDVLRFQMWKFLHKTSWWTSKWPNCSFISRNQKLAKLISNRIWVIQSENYTQISLPRTVIWQTVLKILSNLISTVENLQFNVFFIVTVNVAKTCVSLAILSSPMDLQALIVLVNVDFATFAPSTQLWKNVILSVRRELPHVPKLVTREKPFVWTASVDCNFLYNR